MKKILSTILVVAILLSMTIATSSRRMRELAL